ncbi:Nicotinamidase-related amidase [Syntrophus gentianae]|uniref:Nicotinamidase-related amidase n=1 Tax=Syntrophus gentianae TaxID=43775 RepID=A0A1H8BDA9_9BACT|nr:hydrolase [Syntrophus gentianae]SEM79827.1 Nicotinamidase-related amidase [Syntrophus gentianae]
MLAIENTVLLVIDFQGNLAQAMADRDSLFENARKMIRGMEVFGIPLIVTEQIPAKLGPTIPEIAGLFRGVTPIAKESFSCCQNSLFRETLQQTGRRQILLTGIETHICVYQTALDLLAAGYAVSIVADAVSSRTARNREIGLQMIRDAGGKLTCTEAVLFELLKTAASDKFKEIFSIVK